MATRYQRGNQKQYIVEGQTTQWPKEKVQKDEQRSTKHTHKTKDWVTRTPLKIGGELRCSGRVSSSCSTNGTRHVYCIVSTIVYSPILSEPVGSIFMIFLITTVVNFWMIIPANFWMRIPANYWMRISANFWVRIPANFWVRIPANFWVRIPANFLSLVINSGI